MIKKISISELDCLVEILTQEGVRGYNGKFVDSESEWLNHFFYDERCFVYGWYEKNELVAVLMAETMTGNGCMLWYIAVKPELHYKGYGTRLLEAFEEYVKAEHNVEWIYLIATGKSLDFYKSRGYITSEYSNGWEHVKPLV